MSQPIEHLHPVVDLARSLTSSLDSVAGVPLVSLTPYEKRETLLAITRSVEQLASLKLRLLAEANHSGATTESGAATAADWLAIQTRTVRRDARSELKLAQKLDHHDLVSSALAEGRVNLAQARAIITALDRLPRTGRFAVTAEQRHAAEAHLVELAAVHDARALRVLGRRIFEVIAPDLAEEFEGRALEKEEAEALRRTTLTMREDDEGTCHGRFRIPALHGQILTKMILALTSPARFTSAADTGPGIEGGGGIDPGLPTPVRHGIAFTHLIETIPAASLPKTGGCSATILVTMTLDQLMDRLDAAGVCPLDMGGDITAGEARRLACTAGIIPMVLGGPSQVLDVGRQARFHNEPMRHAMVIRDKGCTAEGCEVPPGLCHAHHNIPHAQGGPTNLDTGRLICPHHHRRIHDPRYQTTHLPNGKLSFHRRE